MIYSQYFTINSTCFIVIGYYLWVIINYVLFKICCKNIVKIFWTRTSQEIKDYISIFEKYIKSKSDPIKQGTPNSCLSVTLKS